MEEVAIRSAALLYKGKRVAFMQDFDYQVNTNDAQEVCDGGTFFTDGRETGKVSATILSPVKGVGVNIVQDALSHKTVDIQLGLVDGKIHNVRGRATTFGFKSEVAAGKVVGNFEWMINKPKVT